MPRAVVLIALLSLCLAGIAEPVGARGDDPRIEVIAPNPVSEGNRGEFVVISFPERTNIDGWTISDGRHTAVLPNRTVEGSVAFSTSPSIAELFTPAPVLPWEGFLPLSADGDELTLADPEGRVVDEVRYPRTRHGERWIRLADGFEPSRAGLSPLVFDAHPVEEVRAFVLPDAPEKPLRALSRADDRILLAGYELTDPAVRRAIIDRHAAGVDVRIVVDGNPVGGQSYDEVESLDELTAVGVPVRVVTGTRARYRFHHPKYAVIDDGALVMTENWKRAGTGGASSRGWGVYVDDPAVAADLTMVFDADYAWRDTVAWERYREDVTPTETDPSGGTYPDEHPPERIPVDSVRVVTAPDSAEEALRELIRDASRTIAVQQVRIGDPRFALVQELLDASRRGVRVRIHLDQTWYVAEENRRLAASLDAAAEAENLPVEIRLADGAGRYEKVHTKGMILDEEVVVLGSMNWNNVSMRENREVLLVLRGEAVASYYLTVFEADWAPPGPQTPVELVAAVAAVWGAAAMLASKRVRFEK